MAAVELTDERAARRRRPRTSRRAAGALREQLRVGLEVALGAGSELEAVADVARTIGLSATSRDNLAEAFDAARKLDLEPSPRILITGSLYLAGEVLRENGTLPQ